ncbi:DUF4349 domain-containing protein [Candidatus Bathyarchaeota archaeon]|nr:DUF4349 domain-containing protein [Candidatus Bathyarchaeota archaeon]
MIRIPKLRMPSRRASIIAAIAVVLTFSAYVVGSSLVGGDGSQSLVMTGHGFSRTDAGDSAEPAAASAAATAASAAADAAKASTGSTVSLYFDVTSGDSVDVGFEVAAVGEYTERMVVFTARLDLVVEDVDEALEGVRLLTERYGGFVSTVNTRSERGSITIRVPQRGFHDAVAEIEGLGEVETRSLQGEDVTEEYVDLQAELTNMERQEERLLDIMDMGTTVDSVLKVERELERVRGSIERLQGRINYLDSRVELATITVNLNLEPEEELEEHLAWFPEVDWGEPVRAGLSVLFTVTQGMITMVIVLGPFAAVGYSGVRAYRHIRKPRVEPETTE